MIDFGLFVFDTSKWIHWWLGIGALTYLTFLLELPNMLSAIKKLGQNEDITSHYPEYHPNNVPSGFIWVCLIAVVGLYRVIFWPAELLRKKHRFFVVSSKYYFYNDFIKQGAQKRLKQNEQ